MAIVIESLLRVVVQSEQHRHICQPCRSAVYRDLEGTADDFGARCQVRVVKVGRDIAVVARRDVVNHGCIPQREGGGHRRWIHGASIGIGALARVHAC